MLIIIFNAFFGICISDEYILPKIAERDLRRFANLLSTSSELGVHLPLDQVQMYVFLEPVQSSTTPELGVQMYVFMGPVQSSTSTPDKASWVIHL